MDLKHRARLIRKLPRAPTTLALHEHRDGPADGESEDALYGADGATRRASAGCGRVRMTPHAGSEEDALVSETKVLECDMIARREM